MKCQNVFFSLLIGFIGFVFGSAFSSISCLKTKTADAGVPSLSAAKLSPPRMNGDEELGRNRIDLLPCSKYVEHRIEGKPLRVIFLTTRTMRPGEVPEDTRVEVFTEFYKNLNGHAEWEFVRATDVLFHETPCPNQEVKPR